MSFKIGGPKTQAMLERGIPLWRNGIRFQAERERAAQRGYRGPNQIVISKAEGDFIWDLDGKRYIDFQNGWATNPVGNCHPEVIDAVDQAHRVYGFHFDHPLRYELAEALAEIMPGKSLPRFSFEVSGTEAAEAAVHAALCYTQRRYIITFGSSYHGNSLATKLLSGLDGNSSRFMEAWTGGVIKAPYPYSDHIPADMNQEQYVQFCLWYLDNHIPNTIAARDNIAAIMIEPGLAEGGNWIPTTGFIQGIRKICNQNDWLMISDEVLTGMGRTGEMWGIDHYAVEPDILVVGKNLSGGIAPCAGIAARDDILGNNEYSSSGSTFAGAPAGCAAGLKTLELYERLNLVENAARLGEMARKVMSSWEEKYETVRQVRLNGLLMGVSFQSPNEEEKDLWYAREIRSQLLKRGVWAIGDQEDNIRMYPALNMDDEVLMEGLSLLEEAIAHVEQHGQTVGNAPRVPTGG